MENKTNWEELGFLYDLNDGQDKIELSNYFDKMANFITNIDNSVINDEIDRNDMLTVIFPILRKMFVNYKEMVTLLNSPKTLMEKMNSFFNELKKNSEYDEILKKCEEENFDIVAEIAYFISTNNFNCDRFITSLKGKLNL